LPSDFVALLFEPPVFEGSTPVRGLIILEGPLTDALETFWAFALTIFFYFFSFFSG
jgi:hypothetical protein